jgi:transposase
MAYSKEFRREVLAACDAGGGTREVALRFGVCESWVRRIKQERRELGKTAPATTKRRTPQWRAIEAEIRQAVADQPDLTLKELKAQLGTELCVQTLCNALRILKLTLKKSPDGRRTGPSRRGPTPGRVAGGSGRPRPRTAGVHR